MTPSLSLAVREALEATEGDSYGDALAAVLDTAGPHADALARRRDALVEGVVVDLAERLYASPRAHLSPYARARLRDHLLRRRDPHPLVPQEPPRARSIPPPSRRRPPPSTPTLPRHDVAPADGPERGGGRSSDRGEAARARTLRGRRSHAAVDAGRERSRVARPVGGGASSASRRLRRAPDPHGRRRRPRTPGSCCRGRVGVVVAPIPTEPPGRGLGAASPRPGRAVPGRHSAPSRLRRPLISAESALLALFALSPMELAHACTPRRGASTAS